MSRDHFAKKWKIIDQLVTSLRKEIANLFIQTK